MVNYPDKQNAATLAQREGTDGMETVSARLERLPFAKPHRRLLLMGGLGYTFDAMDGAVLAFILPIVAKEWSLTSVEMGILASSTYIGYLFGSLSAGAVGDVFGRRQIMMSALAIYSLASLCSAAATGWDLFFWLRVAAGFGMGAEGAIIAPYLAEFVAARYRGRFVGQLAGFFSFGFVAAALLGYLLVPLSSSGWRIVLVITALPIFLLLWWRRALPESPRWLAAQGREAEAHTIVTKMQTEVEALGVKLLPPALSSAHNPLAMSHAGSLHPLSRLITNLCVLWSGRLARITLMMWVTWVTFIFSYYSFFTWIPSLLVQSGLGITKSFAYSLTIYTAQIPGYFSGAYLNDLWGRRATISLGLILGAVSALALALVRTDGLVVLASFSLSLFMNMAAAGLYAYTSEVFPTRVRATGAGSASAVGRLGAIAGPIFVGLIAPSFHFVGVFGVTTLMLAAGAFTVLVLGPRTRGRALEEIENTVLERSAEARATRLLSETVHQ